MSQLREWEKTLISLIDTPYLHQGSSRHGVDCIGLIIHAAETVGLNLREFDIPTRSFVPNGVSLIRGLSESCERGNVWKTGVLVVFRESAYGAQHLACCGIVTEENQWDLPYAFPVGHRYMIHADRLSNRVLLTYAENLTDTIHSLWILPLSETN
jgi:hypothetical protein